MRLRAAGLLIRISFLKSIGRCEDEDKGNAFELHFIYVDPDYLRIGIGSEMLMLFEQKGKESGFEEFVIWVLEENQLGKSFMRSITTLWTGKIRYSSAGTSVRSDM
ncbi:MAG: GNAT family N-acetyltransferase [Saccharofermentans sp.]|nr:GNAT family N-acetyltransferase [Saccharofermentans sp.]